MNLREYLSRSAEVEELLVRHRVQKTAVDDAIEVLGCPLFAWQPGDHKDTEVHFKEEDFPLSSELERLATKYASAHPGKVNRKKF